MTKKFKQLLTPTADLYTSAEMRGKRAIYEVRTSNLLYQDCLLHMGFAFAGEDQFTRNLSAAGDVWRTHTTLDDDHFHCLELGIEAFTVYEHHDRKLLASFG